jgi:WD40 repeat protein
VVAVDWNNKIAHIFASATEDGAVAIWDVKNKKSIFKLYDPNIGLKAFNNETTEYALQSL